MISVNLALQCFTQQELLISGPTRRQSLARQGADASGSPVTSQSLALLQRTDLKQTAGKHDYTHGFLECILVK